MLDRKIQHEIEELRSQVGANRDDIIHLGKVHSMRPAAKFSDVPSWKWIAGITISGLATLFVMWMTSISSDVKSISDASNIAASTALKTFAVQGERMSSMESWRGSTDVRLSRIEGTVDRVEQKLDRVLK